MKLRLGLVVLFCLPLLVQGQTMPAQVGVKFYSKGKMHVVYRDSADPNNGKASSTTTLYINGSAKFTDGASIVQKGRTDITEDFINAMDPAQAASAANPHLFVKATPATAGSLYEGVVAFVGSYNKQSIISTYVTDESQKEKNYLFFPTLKVEKVVADGTFDPRTNGHVAVTQGAAVLVDHLDVAANNRFSVEGSYTSANSSRKLELGQVLLRNVHTADADTEASYSQVYLNMYNKTDGDKFDASNIGVGSNNTLRNPSGENYLTGFTIPFIGMGADYLYYHTLIKPNAFSLTSYEGTITNPYYKLESGYGYFMSMDVTNEDHAQIDGIWGTSSANRQKGSLLFSRKIYEDYLSKTGGEMPKFSRFNYKGTASGSGVNLHDVITNEKFRTEAVTVKLKKGLNFLGNPFMAPINLNYLLGLPYNYMAFNYAGVDDATINNGFDASSMFGSGVFVSGLSNDDAKNMLRAKYWVINNASVKYDGAGMLKYKVTYDFVSRVGGLTTTGIQGSGSTGNGIISSPSDYLIAPMQMFCVQANNEFDITLSPNLRTFGKTTFLKSGNDLNQKAMSDFMVVEVENSIDKTTDRTAVVFRPNARLAANDAYDTSKSLTKQLDQYVDDGSKMKTYPEKSTSVVYTVAKDEKTKEDIRMLGNAVPLETKELALYVTPPTTQQTMKLKFYNLENMTSVPNVWLIDRYENNKTVRLTSGSEYEFLSSPSDLSNAESRFVLRFYGVDSDLTTTDENNTSISCYYNTSVLYISGLNDGDQNSNLQIYDMQGRLMASTKVNNTPSMEYFKPLSLGTYIVKITGKRNFTTKFVNIQN